MSLDAGTFWKHCEDRALDDPQWAIAYAIMRLGYLLETIIPRSSGMIEAAIHDAAYRLDPDRPPLSCYDDAEPRP